MLGYTVRLGGDWNMRRMMSPDEMRASISEIRRRYFNLVRLVVTSDDIARCKEILHDIDDLVFMEEMLPEEQVTLLSLCDYVVNNDSWFIGDCVREEYGFESTFG